jgi:mevalonate kinase
MSVSASAPGKVILFGEHAVVYGRPAVAAQVSQVQVKATVEESPTEFTIRALNLNRTELLSELDPTHPLGAIIHLALQALGEADPPRVALTISSNIPVASGLGSGAAVSTAVARAIGLYFGEEFDPATLSRMVYEVERIHHGTPSGIDNTVIAYERPVYFKRGGRESDPPAIRLLEVPAAFRIAIGDTGLSSSTRTVVADVRRRWEADRAQYEAYFDRCGEFAFHACHLIENALSHELGPLMNDNHHVLQRMDVSSPELDRLVDAARAAGALGAKLSGAGRGGNMIALVSEETEAAVNAALLAAGARRVILTSVCE